MSFVIPAHNEEALLARTLQAIHDACAHGLPESVTYEVVVASDASTDRTAEIARGFSDRSTRVIEIDKRQIAAARNAGASAAMGDMFIFVDADTVITAAAVRAAVRAISRGAVGGGTGVKFDGRIPLYARVSVEVLMVTFRILKLTGGCFLFCTRDAFDAVSGWEETLFASEEITMCRRLKSRGRFVILHHRVITSGRKLRTHSLGEIASILFSLARLGPEALKSRDALDIWYGERRRDPHTDGSRA